MCVRTWTVITTSPSSQTLSVPLPGSVPVSSVPLPDESVPELTLSVPVVPSATLSITPTEQMIQNYTRDVCLIFFKVKPFIIRVGPSVTDSP